MIETIQASTTEGLPFGTPREIAIWQGLDVAGWKHGRAGSWVKQAPGRTTLALETIQQGPHKGNTVLKAKGNLPRLVHGEGAEAFTLHPDDVWRGCQGLVVAVQTFAPWASGDLSDWKVSRVDANATMETLDDDGLAWVKSSRAVLAGQDPEVASYGDASHRARVTAQSQLAVYSKTLDSGTRGPRDGHLVRIEERLFGRKARSVYGETLDTIAREGAVMARTRLDNWFSKLSIQLTSASVESVARLLVRQGMDPATALKLAGAAEVIAAKGVKGLTDLGVSTTTAYRWKSQLDACLTGAEGGVVLTWDDVVWAAAEPVRDA